MKLNLSHTLRLKFAIWLLLTPLSTVLAGSLNVDGDLTVKNTLTVSGTSIVMTGTDGQPGVSALYTDGTTSLFSQIATQPAHEWLWARKTADQSSTVPMMKLDSSHVLTIYDTTGNPAIVLNPADCSGSTSILTLQAADARYLSSNVGLSASNGNIGIGTTSPQAALDVNGSAKIAGNLAISGTGSLRLADGTVLSGSNTLKNVMNSGTALTISGFIDVSQVTGLPSIPSDTNQLANGAGYITASGTAAFAQASATAATVSGTIQASQVANLATVPISTFANDAHYVASSGTASNLALSGTTNIVGTTKVSGDMTVSGKFTVSGSNGISDAMQLDASNRLILTGTATTNPPQLVLDPNITSGTTSVLTQQAADSRYVVNGGTGGSIVLANTTISGTANINGGLAVSGTATVNGSIGIGTTTPSAKLDVAGNLNIGTYSATVPGALLTIGNGSLGHTSNALTVTSLGRLSLFDPSNTTTPTLILDPSLTGTSQLPGTVLITPQGDVGMGPYGSGTQGGSGSAYPQTFTTGIMVSGTSSITGQTVISGTLDLNGAVVLGASSADGSVTAAKLATNSVTTDKMAFDGGALSGFRNRIINGAFTINQRNYASGTVLSGSAYAHDRWKSGASGCTYTFTQNKADTTITVVAGSLMQVIEDVNIEGGDFVLSWTGAAQGRVNGGTYSASPVRVSGLPAGTSVTVEFGTGTIKDVQFESGTTATPFERRFYGAELALCQRYCWLQYVGGIGFRCSNEGNGLLKTSFTYPVVMRANPTLSCALNDGSADGEGQAQYYPGQGSGAFDRITTSAAIMGAYLPSGIGTTVNVPWRTQFRVLAVAEL